MDIFGKILSEASINGQSLTIEYKNASGVVSMREIDQISVNGNNFRANCLLRGEERHFRMDRILSIERKLR